MQKDSKPLIIQPGTHSELHAFGNSLSVMLSGKQTGGVLSVMSETTPPGGGPPLHLHTHEDEIFIVIEGHISYLTEAGWTEVSPGGVVYLPKGAAHTYRNIGTTFSRHWILTTPSGFENFFATCADEFARTETPDPQRIAEIHHQYGIELIVEE